MTLQEKAAQMVCIWQQKPQTLVDAEGNFDAQKAKAAFRDRRGLGQVGRPSDAGKGKNAREMAELTNAIQKFFLENSRLGIPVMFTKSAFTGTRRWMGPAFRSRSRWAQPSIPSWLSKFSPRRRQRLACVERTRRLRRSSTWPASRDEAVWKRRTEKTLSWFRGWALRQFVDSRATKSSATSGT